MIEVEERVELEPVLNESESLFQRSSYNDAYGPGSSYPGVMGTLHTHLSYDWFVAMKDRDEFDALAKAGNFKCLKLCRQVVGTPPLKEEVIVATAADNLGERAGNRVRSWAAASEVMGDWALGHLMASAHCECIVIGMIEQFFLANFGKDGILTVGGGEGRIERIVASRLGPQLAKGLRWVGVGQLRNCNHGKLVPTDLGKDYVAGLEAVNARSVLLNGLRDVAAWRRMAGTPLLVMAGIKALEVARADWRALGLRVALYDGLRERRLTNPTGHSWAHPQKKEWNRRTIWSSAWGDKWGYKAVALNAYRVEQALNADIGNGTVRVEVAAPTGDTPGVYENWNLYDSDTVIISVNYNSEGSTSLTTRVTPKAHVRG